MSPLLNDLHWLRVPQRIEFKLAVLVYRCLCGTVPSYLTALCVRHASTTVSQQMRNEVRKIALNKLFLAVTAKDGQ